MKEPGSESVAQGNTLEELLAQKRTQWQDEKRGRLSNRVQGLWMTLFGLVVISLGFVLFGDEINKARVMIFFMGMAVTGMGLYFAVTGRKMPEDPLSERGDHGGK